MGINCGNEFRGGTGEGIDEEVWGGAGAGGTSLWSP